MEGRARENVAMETDHGWSQFCISLSKMLFVESPGSMFFFCFFFPDETHTSVFCSFIPILFLEINSLV